MHKTCEKIIYISGQRRNIQVGGGGHPAAAEGEEKKYESTRNEGTRAQGGQECEEREEASRK
jgi:hypothetical protein